MKKIETARTRAMNYQWFSQTLTKPDQKELADEFPKLFSYTLTPDSPPYETQYGSNHVFWQSQQLADIAGFYRAFGLQLAEAAHERVDHLAVELEFMGFLALKEVYALQGHDEAHQTIVRDAQAKFLKDHLGRWVGAWAGRIRAKLPDGAYAHLAETLVRFITRECQAFGVKPEVLLFNTDAQRPVSVDEGCPTSGNIPGETGLPCGGAGCP
ncbi:MAG: molecular chaperone TorD family protein [Candidatus Omnitrophica bacterium]|nr:molecular chaperone TorD family protein [Candidatus Omnitrophota bacterium]